MTPIEVRIQFKMESGYYPLYDDQYALRNNKLKSLYGTWLEEKIGNIRKLREEFEKSECKTAIYLEQISKNEDFVNKIRELKKNPKLMQKIINLQYEDSYISKQDLSNNFCEVIGSIV